MATQGGKKTVPAQRRVPSSNGYIPPVHLDVVSVHQEIGEEILGWIACCVLIALLLPLGGMLYLDILDAKNEVKVQTEKLERLRRQIERKQRDKEPDSFADNPVFDRVRRPLSLPLPRPNKLE
jgi:hypothetical protein